MDRIKSNIQKMIDQGADESEIDRYISSEGVTPEQLQAHRAQQPAQTPDRPPAIYNTADEIASTLTLGTSDEILSGALAPVRALGRTVTGDPTSIGEAYDEGLERYRAAQKQFREERPGAAIGSSIAGGALVGATAAPKAIAKGAGLVENIIRSGVTGAGIGGAAGFGEGEGGLENRLKKAGEGAVLGFGIGAAVPGSGRVVGKAVQGIRNRIAAKAAPSVEALRTQATRLYNASEKAGVVIKQGALKKFSGQLEKTLADAGIDEGLHPAAFRAMQRVRGEADRGNITLKGLDMLRQIAGDAAGDPLARDAQKGMVIKNALSDFFDTLKPSDVVTGDVRGANRMIKEARSLYHRQSKSQAIEKVLELAELRAGQYSQSGMENALRTEFRGLARRIIKGQEKGWTKAEIQAIKKVATGGGDIAGNAARLIGKMAVRGPVSAGFNLGVSGVTGIPGAGVASAVLGEASKAASGAMTRGAARQASALARSGGPLASLPMPQKDIAQALLLGQSAQAPRVAEPAKESGDALVRALIRGGY